MNLNTVLTGLSWAQFEPEEGKYDFALVDGLLAGARQQNLKIIFVWFGTWKNGMSSFAPAWVKADQKRFPRAQLGSGRSIEVLSTLSEENLKADSRAYQAFMHHLRQVDADKHTVVMIQVENEVGVLGDSRDRSAVANEAFARPVPRPLLDYLHAHQATLRPELKKALAANGDKASGTWTEVFGSGMADEVFMAWNYAHYMNQVTKAGKSEYPVPVFTNTWIVQPEDRGPGDYPSGCPEPHVLDIWRAGGPDIDLNAPDIYLPNFAEWVARFHQNGNTLFVPESRGDAIGVANAFYAIGQQDSIGYSPFGIDSVTRLLPASTTTPTTTPTPSGGTVNVQDLPLTQGYDILRQLTPLILEHQGSGSLGAVLLNPGELSQTVAIGNYNVTVSKIQNRRSTAVASTTAEAAPTYAMIIGTGPDQYVIAASNAEITFSPITPGPSVAGLAQVQAGSYADGVWVPGRWLNGDDVLLNYKIAEAAATNQSGSGLRFSADGPAIQKVSLYRYQ
jgi:beta-galactosidase GanA